MIETAHEHGGAWLRIRIAAPPGNLVTMEVVQRLRHLLAQARSQRGLKWLTLEGAGKDFGFGASVAEHVPEQMQQVLPETHRLVKDLLAFPAPTAALVQGRCLGGSFELALACDDILAESNAVLGLPEVRLCAFPPGAAALLPLRVGASRAARAIVTGEPRPAQYWHEAGLVSLVAGHVALADAARDWFDRYLAPRSTVALHHAAEASRLTLRAIAEPAIDSAERQYLERLLSTADAREGIQAFLDKRPAQWRDE